MFMRPLPALCCVIVAAAALTACGAGAGESRVQTYSRGSAPLEAAGSSIAAASQPQSRSYASDAKKLKDSINTIPGVTDSSVLFNGLTAFITLHLGKDVDIEESMRIRRAAQETIERLLPQYQVRVSVEKNHVF